MPNEDPIVIPVRPTLIPNLSESFPNDPCNFQNATAFAEEAKKQLWKLGPFQPLVHHLDGCTFPRTQFPRTQFPRTQFPRTKNDRPSFQGSWYKCMLNNGTRIDKEWLEYSPRKDSIFCFSCRMFGSAVAQTAGDNCVSVGLNNWKKGRKKVKLHEHSQVHIEAAIVHKNFVSKGCIIDQISNETANQKQKEIQENRQLLTRLLDSFFPGKTEPGI